MQVQQKIIAKYKNQDIIEYEISISDNFLVSFLNYGGIITAIKTLDKNNNLDNIVLKHPIFTPQNPGHFGAITGQIAGRINKARFNLDNQDYILDANNGIHNLHGGLNGLDKQIFKVNMVPNGAILTYKSTHLESGFPGNIQFRIEYLIMDDNSLVINYHAIPDCNTIINLTNHSYFDLSCGKNTLNQELTIPANYYALVDNTNIVTKEIKSVENSPFDFRQAKAIGRDINAAHEQLQLANGYDHPFILNDNKIILTDPESKRYLEITTDQAVCVVYTANHIKHSAICLETQNMPDAINWDTYRDSIIYTPDKPYYSHNIWKFGLIK